MKRNWRVGLLLLAVVTLTGCSRTRILERIGLVVAAGYETGGDGMLKASTVVQQVEPGSQTEVQVITSTAATSKGLREQENRKSGKKLQAGQIRVVLYSKELAQKGLRSLTDTLFRDPTISNAVYLSVVDGDVHDLLSHKYSHIKNIGAFLFNLLRQNIQGEDLISCTLHEFLFSMYSLEDPVLPILQRQGDQIVIKNVAVFDKDKMVHTVSMRDSLLIKLIRGRFKTGFMEFNLTKEEMGDLPADGDRLGVVLNNIQSRSSLKLESAENLQFKVKIRMKVDLQEATTSLNFGDPDTIKKLQKAVENKLQAQCRDLLEKMQQIPADPFGFGEVYRSSMRNSQINHDQWQSEFSKAKFNIDVQTKIMRTGKAQ